MDLRELGKYVNVWNKSKGEFELTFVGDSKKDRADMIRDTTKYPGDYNLGESILIARQEATKFDKSKQYNSLIPRTRDWVSYWEKQKELSYTGVMIDDVYLSGDMYWYLNFIRIPNKVERKETFPDILDSDIWFMNHIELAPYLDKFTVTVKKRQWGFSLKMIAKQLKRFTFEETFAGKISSFSETYVRENWKLLDNYRDHLQACTAWKRPLDPYKALDWMQKIRLNSGSSKGLKSVLKGITTKNNPAAVVSGKTDFLFTDEAGINPTLGSMIEFMTPALTYNSELTGEMHIGGAVGRLKDCKPLKKIFMHPDDNGFLGVPNVWADRPSENVGLFIPQYYNYFTDKYGNSDIERAKVDILERADQEKRKSYKSYMMYLSQRPMTPADAFAEREENLFPIHIIKPHYERIENEYQPLKVELFEENGRVKHRLGSKWDIVEDFPVNKNTIKHGAIVIDEMPYPDAPRNLYYAGVDTISPGITTSSVSLQSIYIYKAAHEIDGEFSEEKIVAWYAGRPESNYGAFEITKNLIKFYNANAGIENDNKNFVEWMIKERQQKHIMRRNDFPLNKDLLAKSAISNIEYGIRTGNASMKVYLTSLAVEYVTEIIGTRFNPDTGESDNIYGVERIKDKMLLYEMLNYTPKKNVDRIVAFSIALFAARSNTNRGIKVIQKQQEYNRKVVKRRPSSLNQRRTKSVFSR